MSKWWCCSGEENPLDYLFVGSIYNERLGRVKASSTSWKWTWIGFLSFPKFSCDPYPKRTRADHATRGSRLDAQLWMTIRLYDAAV